MTDGEFAILIADASKRIEGDIDWQVDEDHSPAIEFFVEVGSDPGYPLFIKGSLNAAVGKLTFAMIHRGCGRVYALDLGSQHHNPSCTMVGECHKHRWTELSRDKEAYVPPDITAGVGEPIEVWKQFCMEANIRHLGQLRPPPPVQLELF